MSPTCWRCKYFVTDSEDPDFGECHRYPRIGLHDEDDIYWAFPMMECLDWCGEFVEDEEE